MSIDTEPDKISVTRRDVERTEREDAAKRLSTERGTFLTSDNTGREPPRVPGKLVEADEKEEI